MGYKRIHICDSCGKELNENKNTYVQSLTSKIFTDAAGDRDYNVINVELCENCARRLVTAIERIAEEGNATEREEG